MKKIIVIAAVLFLCGACKNNTTVHQHEHSETVEHHHEHSVHEHEHHHEHSEATEHHQHEHQHSESAETHQHNHSAAGDIILAPEKAHAAGVVAEIITPKDFRQVISVSGRIESSQNAEMSIVANVAGVVSFNRPLVSGTQVTQGNTLLSISSHNLQDGDPVERAKIAYQAAEEEYNRAKRLIDDKIISEKDFNAIRERYENARLTYQAVAKDNSNNGATVTAPTNGYIKEVFVKEGDYVTVGQTLATVAQDNILYLYADIPERYYGYMNNITSANFSTVYSNQVYELDSMNGEKVSYSRALASGSGYATMTFSFKNDGTLVPGSFANIYLLAENRPNTIAIPNEALVEEQGLYFVFIKMCEESYSKRQVKIGASNGKEVEITDGIHSGDNVVVKGAYHVKLASTSASLPAHSHSH
ncbi:MAG: efflux RND transporter periplasmic adaptor subunit [Bacteroidaceae bacterium]|nr:efflux RND transporter periplasmic adaptor subunit [Bacteroidaceae bacterium]